MVMEAAPRIWPRRSWASTRATTRPRPGCTASTPTATTTPAVRTSTRPMGPGRSPCRARPLPMTSRSTSSASRPARRSSPTSAAGRASSPGRSPAASTRSTPTAASTGGSTSPAPAPSARPFPPTARATPTLSSSPAPAAGFPKSARQWQAFAGVVADPLMNGQLVYATPTREGFVFTWKVAGKTELNDSWWHYRHDERNTGAYGVDTRRPASILDLRVVRGPQPLLVWTAPGDDYMVGTADRYDARWSNQPINSSSFWSATPLAGAPAPQPAGSQQSMAVGGVSGSTVYFAIRTLDMEGNVSALSNVAW